MKAIIFALLLLRTAAQGTDPGSTGPWEALGLQPGASDAEIKQAFRRLALDQHPDRGGDAEAFIAVRTAYEELTQRRDFWMRRPSCESGHDRGRSSFEQDFHEAWEQAIRRVRSTLPDGSYWDMPETELLAGQHDLGGLFQKQFSGRGVRASFHRADGSEIASGDVEVRFGGGAGAIEGTLPSPPHQPSHLWEFVSTSAREWLRLAADDVKQHGPAWLMMRLLMYEALIVLPIGLLVLAVLVGRHQIRKKLHGGDTFSLATAQCQQNADATAQCLCL